MIRKINYKDYEFTTIKYNDEILFWGKEVCEYLEYANGSRDIERHTEEDERILLKNKDIKEIQTYQNGTSEIEIKLNNRGEWFITELGLYGLILGSEKKEAKEFKKWVKQTIRDIRDKSGLEAFEAFRMMDKDIQKRWATYMAESGNIDPRTDNIVMNKNVNMITSTMYSLEPPITKGEMEKVHPEMLIDRQKVLNDYCILFDYTQSHKQTKNMMLEKFN